MGVDYAASSGYGIVLSEEEIWDMLEKHANAVKLPEYYDTVEELIEDAGVWEAIEALLEDSGLDYAAYGSVSYGGDGGFIVGSVHHTDYLGKIPIEKISQSDEITEKLIQFMDKFGIDPHKEIAFWSGVHIY